MGEVFLAYDPRLDRQVAIKRIRPDTGLEAEHRRRLQREARVAAGLLHPAIVQVFDLLTIDDVDPIVMEYVPGTSLRRALDAGPLPLAEGLRIAGAVADALAYAHQKGVVHRDLKSENVLLTPEGDAKIADFGIARRLVAADGSTADETLTRAGAVIGTYRTMSPEQAYGDPVDARSDLFSFGVLLYETFAGESPFLARTNVQTLERLAHDRPPPLRERAAGVPPALSELVDHLLEKDPRLRPRDAFEVAERLESIGESVRLEDESTRTAGSTEPAVPAAPHTEVTQTIHTLMLTDLVHSTDLVSRLGDRRAMELNGRHDHMARALVASHCGREIDKADGFLLLFDRPIEAARCALDYHAALEEMSRREGVEIKARAGIHLGEVFLRENPPEEVRRGAKPLEVEGLAKAIVARVADLGGSGQTLITRGAFELAQRADADEPGERPLRWMSHGLYRFQGVEEPIEVCEVGIERRSPLRPPTAAGKARRVVSGSGTYGTARRRAWIAVAIVAVLGIAVAVAVMLRPPSSMVRPIKPVYVAVMRPEPQTQVSPQEAERLAFAIRQALMRTLISLDGIAAKTTAEVDAIDGSPTRVAQAVAADELITSSFTCHIGTCWVELNRVRGGDGSVTWNDQTQVPLDGPLVAARAISVLLLRGYPDRSQRSGSAKLNVSREDYAAFLEVKRIVDEGSGTAERSKLLEQLEAIRNSSDRFLDAYLLGAELALRQFHELREPAAIEEALQLIARAQSLAPGAPDVLFQRAICEIFAGQLELAEETLATLEVMVPGHVEILDLRARLYRRQGDARRALELYEQAIQRQPTAQRLIRYADLALREGNIGAARDSAASYLELLPGNRRGLTLLATVELVGGQPARAVELYEELVKRSPRASDLSNLATAHMLLRSYDAAAAAAAAAVGLVQNNAFAVLNLADSRWLQGHRAEAADLYHRVLMLLDKDPTTTEAQYLTARAQALAHLGDSQKAVATIQEALRMAPGDNDVAFEAALVYTLVGDQTAALVNAEDAIELGRQIRWFDLPWFDALRARPEFARLVSR